MMITNLQFTVLISVLHHDYRITIVEMIQTRSRARLMLKINGTRYIYVRVQSNMMDFWHLTAWRKYWPFVFTDKAQSFIVNNSGTMEHIRRCTHCPFLLASTAPRQALSRSPTSFVQSRDKITAERIVSCFTHQNARGIRVWRKQCATSW